MNNVNDKKLSNIIVLLMICIIGVIAYILFKDKFIGNYSITLKGDNPTYLMLGDDYIEPGFVAYDENGLEVTEKVKVTNKININQEGLYDVKYKIGGQEIIRKVEVLNAELKIILTKDTDELTKDDVTITVKIIGKSFSGVLLPDDTKASEKDFIYRVSSNGTYVFKAYNEEGEEFSETVIVSNIDKDPPKGTCKATIDSDKTEIIVNVSDTSGIKEYCYLENGKEIYKGSNSSYIHNSKMSRKISVDVTDKIGNKNNIICEIEDNTVYEPLLPNSSDNVVYKGETDTLKFYVISRGSYYLTRIWVEDPYNQLNKYDSPEYGKNLYRPISLIENAIAQNNSLSNKLILAFNASGFYLKDTYDAASVNRYSGYDKTSVGTIVITDGKLVRNVYDKAYKTWYTMGINPDNKMVIFEDAKASTADEINNKKKWADDVINSGIRNTYTFAAPLIQNGVRTNITTSMPGGFDDRIGLQLICQINDNNFALFTSSSEKRNTGINAFLGIGCQTATNLDGGGSIALLYKDKNSTSINTVIGGARQLPEVAYFSE